MEQRERKKQRGKIQMNEINLDKNDELQQNPVEKTSQSGKEGKRVGERQREE